MTKNQPDPSQTKWRAKHILPTCQRGK